MKQRKTPLGVALLVILASLACGIPALPTVQPVDTATPDKQMTAMVQTLTALYRPTSLPTKTFTPVPPTKRPTETAIPFPTITPIPSFTPQPTFTPFGTLPPGVDTLTPKATGTLVGGYGCKLIQKDPGSWATFKPRKSFTASFTLVNTGVNVWPYGGVTAVYLEGEKLQTNNIKFVNIPGDVKPGEQAIVQVAMTAPKKQGTHTTTWGLMKVKQNILFCTFTVQIIVK